MIVAGREAFDQLYHCASNLGQVGSRGSDSRSRSEMNNASADRKSLVQSALDIVLDQGKNQMRYNGVRPAA